LAQAANESRESAGFRENILFTHRGLSGPAVLQLSSYWRPGEWVTANLCPQVELYDALREAQRQSPTQQIQTFLGHYLARKLVQVFLSEADTGRNLASFSHAELQRIADQFAQWRFLPAGTEGYRTAEVTLGGVDTQALSSKTLVCRAIPGLYFIGEVVDVTGQLGGYNFQWAWASGFAAGQALCP
jgi:predicted Rossmann fold flavoprotein